MFGLTLRYATVGILTLMTQHVFAQITPTRTTAGTAQSVVRLEDQLINGLRATREEQQAFLKSVVVLSEQGKLDKRLINAIYVWSRRRQPLYPFPFFERGLRIEAQKRGIALPVVNLVQRVGGVTPPLSMAR
ncbi:hypothetical protein EC9_13130 [Rosistilla ulvae]|uniref:Uncharacterized protein n=2 Tax=Rosistilla ulvae TaxID=1930277 RepID=A0A517LWZ2_9BACT|nr:hypothetical protein EC9_13130 [Rosistilla ulvae]